MSIITDTDLLTRISMLPDSVKADVVDYIDKRLETESAAPPKKKTRRAGWAKDKFTMVMHDDFDEPLEEFREYME